MKAHNVIHNGAATNGNSPATTEIKTVSICDTQPVTVEGLRTLLSGCPDLRFLEGSASLDTSFSSAVNPVVPEGALKFGRRAPDVLIVDKAFGVQAILDWMAVSTPESGAPGAVVVWGVSVTEAEALRFLQAGARGILRKTTAISAIVACLRTVAAGRSWMEDCVFRDSPRQDRYPRTELTAREQQVLELVEQGSKNKEIAQELGIRPGTVKIHLKHIFEKTGIRGRYGLALNGWRERAPATLSA